MFDKHFYVVRSDRSAEHAANIVAKSNAALGRKLESISQAEIKSKDRVDISLEEYEKLKRELSILRDENRELKHMLQNMGIPVDIVNDIVPDSISVERCKNHVDFKTLFRITFAVYDNGRWMP